MKEFFLVCPIGLENYLLYELQLKYGPFLEDKRIKDVKIDIGGIALQTSLEIGLGLNQVMKTPSKILLRLKSQKCRDLPKLYNIIRKMDWKSIFKQNTIAFHATSSKSRLINTKKMINTAADAIKDYFEANKLKVKELEESKDFPVQTIFLRLQNDDLNISLDTSGELLHIRGDRSFRGHASIRENIATLLLLSLIKNLKGKTIKTLLDPMCGTGTFLFEAQNFYKQNNRSFNFQYTKLLTATLPDLKDKVQLFEKYYGQDIDNEIISKNKNLASQIQFKTIDLFNMTKIDFPKERPVTIINPPYGKRVKIEGNKKKYFQNIIQTVKKEYNPSLLGIIIPIEQSQYIQADKRIKFSQNGFPVEFLIFS